MRSEEQMKAEEQWENFGRQLASFHSGLVHGGMSEDAARELVLTVFTVLAKRRPDQIMNDAVKKLLDGENP